MAQLVDKQELAEFDSVFPDILKCLTEDIIEDKNDGKIPVSRFKEVIEYNVPNGVKLRGLIAVKAFKLLSDDKVDKNDLFLAHVFGWCIEIFNGFMCIQDDLMDRSETRRGRMCWYKKDGIGLSSIMDALMLEVGGMYGVLKKFFKNKPYYVEAVDMFRDASFRVAMGELYDMIVSPETGKLDFTRFTMETFTVVAHYKNTWSSFYFPIVLAMMVKGLKDEKLLAQTKDLTYQLGVLFQLQDDYIDCYGDPAVSGKIGTDIEGGKCTWMVVRALELSNTDQTTIIKENYGRNDEQCIAKIRQVYKELDIENRCLKYEDELYEDALKSIEQLDSLLMKNMFREIAKPFYKRRR